MNIIYEDDSIIVVEKPAGVESQESKGLAKDMVSEIKKHLKKNSSKDLYVGVVHRLDKPVRGIMVYAKTKQAAAELSKQMATAGHMDKIYLAVCEGVPKNAKLTLKDYIAFDRKTNSSRVVKETNITKEKNSVSNKRANENVNDANEIAANVHWDNPEAKQAELELELLDTFSLKTCDHIDGLKMFEKQLRLIEGSFEEKSKVLSEKNETVVDTPSVNGEKKLSLVRVKLKTGRHHQIRVQLANAGLPIVGDTKYNQSYADYRGLPALCLCSVEIGFAHPVTKKTMSFTLDR